MRNGANSTVTVPFASPISNVRVSELSADPAQQTDVQGLLLQTETPIEQIAPPASAQQKIPSAGAPAPLSNTTRRFLRPLVGIDPASVRVNRGETANQLTSAQAADAVTVGNEIVLSSGHPEETPETLGLLAHELTHVARQRNPRFIPPVARHATDTETEVPHVSSSEDDEEALARQVEVQIRQVARAWVERGRRPTVSVEKTQANTPPKTQDAFTPSAPTVTTRQDAVYDLPPPDAEASTHTQQPMTRWGQLPAPWEPLPEWVTAPQPETTASAPEPRGLTEPPAMPQPSGTVMRRAARGRTITQESGDALDTAPHPPERTRQPEPDLDALARQVYVVLKRRLAAERRREG
jgi:hypothetical protein